MQQTVAVIGLGYVGLPLAVRAVERGYAVVGFDTHQEKIARINRQECPIEDASLEALLKRFPFEATDRPGRLNEADIVLICVPTPVDEMYYPDLEPVISAATLSATHLKPGALVVLESTVNPGVSEEVIMPLFEKHGHRIGKDVFLAHCPERINPGDEKWNVTNIPRVVGSVDAPGLEKALEFYRSIVDGEIRPMKSIREAEAVKVVENSFRDINIAFVNELARSFDVLGIDVKDVIQGAATKPFSFMPHYPSCGVGGHCIPVDPYYLIERAKKSGFDHRFLKIAREINNAMPAYSVYPEFACTVADEGEVMSFAKTGGSQRPVGLIFPGDDRRQIFLGTMMLGDETRPMDYGRDALRDMAGAVERIGTNRWRLILPYPNFESVMDVIELVPQA